MYPGKHNVQAKKVNDAWTAPFLAGLRMFVPMRKTAIGRLG